MSRPLVRQGCNSRFNNFARSGPLPLGPKFASLLIPLIPTFQVVPRLMPPTSSTITGLSCER